MYPRWSKGRENNVCLTLSMADTIGSALMRSKLCCHLPYQKSVPSIPHLTETSLLINGIGSDVL